MQSRGNCPGFRVSPCLTLLRFRQNERLSPCTSLENLAPERCRRPGTYLGQAGQSAG
jgi:hypothetical protein